MKGLLTCLVLFVIAVAVAYDPVATIYLLFLLALCAVTMMGVVAAITGRE